MWDCVLVHVQIYHIYHCTSSFYVYIYIYKNNKKEFYKYICTIVHNNMCAYMYTYSWMFSKVVYIDTHKMQKKKKKTYRREDEIRLAILIMCWLCWNCQVNNSPFTSGVIILSQRNSASNNFILWFVWNYTEISAWKLLIFQKIYKQHADLLSELKNLLFKYIKQVTASITNI